MTCAKNRREKPMAARLAWGFTAQKPAFRLPGTPRSLTGRRLLRGQLLLAPQVPPVPPRQRVVTAVLAGRLGQWSLLRSLTSLLYPLDSAGAVRRFLEYWRPDLGVFLESELWPNLILAAEKQGVKLALVNARMSVKTLRQWENWPAAGKPNGPDATNYDNFSFARVAGPVGE